MGFEYRFGRNGVLGVTMFNDDGADPSGLSFSQYKIVEDHLVRLPQDIFDGPSERIKINSDTLTLGPPGQTTQFKRKPANESVNQVLADTVADLKSADDEIRRRAVGALRYAGPEARGGVPSLIAMLDGDDDSVWQGALEALASIGPQEKPVVPALVEVLKSHDDAWMRVRAARELASFGPDAKAAVPALRECAQSSDKHLVQSAADALKRIDPCGRLKRRGCWLFRNPRAETSSRLIPLGVRSARQRGTFKSRE